MKTGLLLVNLGTPAHPSTKSVRRYLRQFLSDGRVLDLPWPLRMLLLYGIILPFRPKKSAKAYQAIWTKAGSPLLRNSEALCNKLQEQLNDDWVVALGMRYGAPSIASAIDHLLATPVKKIVVLPMFPQYASSSYGSAVQEVYDQVRTRTNVPALDIIPPFYDHPMYINALVQHTQSFYGQHAYDHLIMSFHGLPERHVIASDHGKPSCDLRAPCPAIHAKNHACYRAQSYATARLLAQGLGLKDHDYTVGFQSRLGKTPWIQPYTDALLPELYAKGHRNIAVVCPSFTADCLETLEEIGIGLQEDWQAMGGKRFDLIPCLNDADLWATPLAQHLSERG